MSSRFGAHRNWGRDMPQFDGRADDGSLVAMAQGNNWRLDQSLPTMADGTPIDLSGGPLEHEFWRALAPVVVAQAGYWPFVACTVAAQTRAGQQAAYAVTAMALPGALPYVHCYPETWRARVTSVVPEVDLESGDFNDTFAVFAEDPRAAYSVLSPRTMAALVHSPPVDELWTSGNHLCMARIDSHSATALDAHLRILTQCAGDMPTSAWQPGGTSPTV